LAASERASLVIAGAVVGVLGVLLTLFALVGQLDARYPTRREYEATLASINNQLGEIKAELQANRPRNEKPRP
jgi:hypothetical protein